MKQKGFYSFKKEDCNIKTKYIIEYSTDQKDVPALEAGRPEKANIKTIEFDYIEDAMNTYNQLYYYEGTVHLMLYEQIIYNDNIILEQCKTWGMPVLYNSILEKETKRANQAEEKYLKLEEENIKLKNFLKKYKIDPEQITAAEELKNI